MLTSAFLNGLLGETRFRASIQFQKVAISMANLLAHTSDKTC